MLFPRASLPAFVWKASCNLCLLLFLLALPCGTAVAQNYGPPKVAVNGYSIFPFQGTDSAGRDVYGQNAAALNEGGDGYYVTIASDYTAVWWASHPPESGTYDPVSKQFSIPYVFTAISADGNSFLGSPEGVTLTAPPSEWATLGTGMPWEVTSHALYPDMAVQKSDSTGLLKWVNLPNRLVFRVHGTSLSPWYMYVAGNGDLQITESASGDWTPSNINIGSVSPGTPLQLYYNGNLIPAIGATSGGGTDYWAEVWYETSNQQVISLAYGTTAGGNYAYLIDPFWNTFSVNPSTWQVMGVTGEDISIHPPTVNAHPSYGPPLVVLENSLLTYAWTDTGGGFDIYTGASSLLTVAADGTAGSITFQEGYYARVGIYNPEAPGGFTNLGVDSVSALDENGNLMGVPPGLTVISAHPSGTNVAQSDRSQAPMYPYPRPNGTFGSYCSVADGVWFLVSDQNSQYTSPLYRYSASTNGGRGMVIDHSSGSWPPSNAYPRQLYINNVAWQLDTATISQNGQQISASDSISISGLGKYHPQMSTESEITLSWSMSGLWYEGFNFSWSISAMPSSDQFAPDWDGNTNLLGFLANGAVVSLNPVTPSQGPAQIDWNGVTLDWDVQQSVTQGKDVYHDNSGLGLGAVIDWDGTVTLTQAGGSTLTGTYNAGTSAFSFDGSAGSVYAMNNQGVIIQPGSGSGTNQDFDLFGNLDIQGNLLSFGNWTTVSNSSAAGLLFTFTDQKIIQTETGPVTQPSLLNSASLRATTVFGWSHAAADGSTTQNVAMQLDGSNRLSLYSPVPPVGGAQSAPTIILDPNGVSHVKGPMIIAPQGDLDMGVFRSGTLP